MVTEDEKEVVVQHMLAKRSMYFVTSSTATFLPIVLQHQLYTVQTSSQRALY